MANPSKKLLEKEIKLFPFSLLHLKNGVSLKYFVTDCLWKSFFDSNSSQTSSKLISLTILVTMRLFTMFYFKIRAIKLEKTLKFALLGNCFFDHFDNFEVEICY